MTNINNDALVNFFLGRIWLRSLLRHTTKLQLQYQNTCTKLILLTQIIIIAIEIENFKHLN